MDNLVDAFECRGDGGLVADVGIDGLDAELRDIGTSPSRRVVERPNGVAALEQLRNQICSDEAVRARDEDSAGDQASSESSVRLGVSPMCSDECVRPETSGSPEKVVRRPR